MTWAGAWRAAKIFGAGYLLLAASVAALRWAGVIGTASDLRSPAIPPSAMPAAGPKLGDLRVAVERWSEEKGQHVATRFVPMTWQRVSRSEMGAAWPLTSDVALVGCSKDLPMFSVLLFVDGVPWALNGTTKGWARGDKYRLDVGGRPVVVRVGDGPEPWWAVGESTPRKNIQPLFEVAERIGCLLPPGVPAK